MPFKKGQSGNPAGRKPNHNRIMLEKALEEAGKDKTFLEHIAEQAFIDNSMAKEVLKKLIPDLSSVDSNMLIQPQTLMDIAALVKSRKNDSNRR